MTRRTLELAAFCVALLVAALAIHAWLASREEQRRLAATLAAQKQVIDAADANERANQSSLANALAQIEKLKRDTQTPAQILAALPKYLPLPQPITLAQSHQPEQGIPASPSPLPANPAAPSLDSWPAEGSRSAGVSPANFPPADSWRGAANVPSPPGGTAPVECGGELVPSAVEGPPSHAGACSGAQSASDGDAQRDTDLPGSTSRRPGDSPAVEARGFSAARKDGRVAPSLLPQAVAQAEGPERQITAPSAPCTSAADCTAQIPAANGRAAPSSVEGQGLGPGRKGRAQRDTDLPGSTGPRPGSPSTLPQAVAKVITPEQQGSPSALPCDASENGCTAQIPAADLKPLFDYVQNCRACQAELAAAKQNSENDAAKIAALTRERDAAITAAKGGSFLRRLRRNALWFAIGAAGGYVAARR